MLVELLRYLALEARRHLGDEGDVVTVPLEVSALEKVHADSHTQRLFDFHVLHEIIQFVHVRAPRAPVVVHVGKHGARVADDEGPRAPRAKHRQCRHQVPGGEEEGIGVTGSEEDVGVMRTIYRMY